MLNHPQLLIIGASGRFLAQSANLMGCQVSVVDLFADVDTRQLCKASRKFSSVENSVSWARKIEALGDFSEAAVGHRERAMQFVQPEKGTNAFTIVFAGGAENYPEFFRPGFWGPSQVAGPSACSIMSLLDWSNIQTACRQLQILTPHCITDANQVVDMRYDWLRKQIRSGGGLHLEPWTRSKSVDFEAGEYLQQRLDGVTISGCFVAKEDDGRGPSAQLLGACQQFANQDLNDFRYQGSLGPLRLDQQIQKELRRVGQLIAAEFSLIGVFGIDFIFSEDELFLVDINPRVPASAELIERYYRIGRSDFTIIGVHLDAALRGHLPLPMTEVANAVFSKRIVYLESELPLTIDRGMVKSCQCLPFLTDIPAAGTVIRPHHPLATVHSQSHDQVTLQVESERQLQELEILTRRWGVKKPEH